LKTILRLLKES